MVDVDKNKRREKYVSKDGDFHFLRYAWFPCFLPFTDMCFCQRWWKFIRRHPQRLPPNGYENQEVIQPKDQDFFTLFPIGDEEAPTTPAELALSLPISLLPSAIPIDVIHLASDIESVVCNNNRDDGEVDVVVNDGGIIANRVSTRRRAHFASSGDVLRHDQKELAQKMKYWNCNTRIFSLVASISALMVH